MCFVQGILSTAFCRTAAFNAAHQSRLPIPIKKAKYVEGQKQKRTLVEGAIKFFFETTQLFPTHPSLRPPPPRRCRPLSSLVNI